jgi:NADPH2:quinone reductase
MILMAGRTAKPALPLGSFYPRDCSILGFAMFNATPIEQKKAAEDINRWTSEGKLHALIGREFPLDEAADAHRFLEANTLQGAGTLRGKVLITVA